MGVWDDWAAASRAVADPGTPASDLAAIAAAQPGLRAQIAAHPAAYPGLLDWLAETGDAEVKAAVATRRAGHPAPVAAATPGAPVAPPGPRPDGWPTTPQTPAVTPPSRPKPTASTKRIAIFAALAVVVVALGTIVIAKLAGGGPGDDAIPITQIRQEYFSGPAEARERYVPSRPSE
jgi:hypothetical protein